MYVHTYSQLKLTDDYTIVSCMLCRSTHGYLSNYKWVVEDQIAIS